MQSQAATKVQVTITYVNGLGDTATTSACFETIEAMTETLRAYGAERVMSIQFTN